MPTQLEGLVFRLLKGEPLTPQEGDANLAAIQNFCDALSQLLSQVVNDDGTLVDGALNSPSQLANIPVLSDTFLANLTLIKAVSAGANYTVANPSITAYVAGMKLQFLADADCHANPTAQFNGLAIVPIVKSVNVALGAGEIAAGAVVELVYDGVNFQLEGMASSKAVAADVVAGTSTTLSVTPNALKNAAFVSQQFPLAVGQVANLAHALAATPISVRWVLVCQNADSGYVAGDEVLASCFFCQFSNNLADTYSCAFVGGANVTNVFLAMSALNNGNSVAVANKGTGVNTQINLNNWKAKCYASVI